MNQTSAGRPRVAQCDEVDAGSGAAGQTPRRGNAPARLHEPLPTRVEGLPELPGSYRSALAPGLAALGLADIPAAALARIDGHVRLLLAWTTAINLTAIREPAAVAREHVLDSLAAVPVLRAAGSRLVLDLGSGGGFPGLPLAAALEPERTLLVESIGKKARFLATAAAAIGLEASVKVAATRAERLAGDPHHRGRWEAVVARAVGSLAELAELGLPLLRQGGLLVAWKRTPLEVELDAARRALGALGGELGEIRPVGVEGLGNHRLVVVVKARPTPAAYPRDPAIRKRRPW